MRVVGLEIGEFRVEQVLGRGGMGVVYLATQRSLERRVALKVIAPQLAEDERFRTMFLREARAAAAIDHPHVLPIYETGTLQDTVYLAMRYVDGSDLERLLRLDDRLAPERAVAIVTQVADALDAAHARGLLHRDVKPANVLVDAPMGREHAYLSDFGLARQATDAQTQPGGWAGTLDYVAPELLDGKPPSIASDVYALGCLLFQALSGRVPFPGESVAEKIAARFDEALLRLAGLPAGLEAVVARALAPDAARRYASAGALARAATQALVEPGDSVATAVDASPAMIGHRGNLRVARTRFIGRERELAELARLLEQPGLVTIVGTGGAGKTRLATELGHRLAGRFLGGVWLAELAGVGHSGAVATAIAAPFGLDRHGDRAPIEAVGRHLASRCALLVLDNCEHVIEAAAAAADVLLAHAPDLAVLATSREPLAIDGEQVWRIPPLALPGAGADDSDAVILFTDRARLARPGFTTDAHAIADICHRLDGVPLAIELAAARVGSLPVAEIAARLDDRFALLTTGGRSAPGRHRTLRAAVDWSHDLLGDADRALLRRLSVFRGSFTIAAAEEVCDGDVTALADRSLVAFDGEERYHLLETIRAYSAQRLAEAGEHDAYARRHAEHFVALAEVEGPAARRSVRHALRRLDADRDNLAAALVWTHDHDHALHVRLACALGGYWVGTGQKDAVRWLDSALAAPAAPAQRGALLADRVRLRGLGIREASQDEAQEAIELLIACGDEAGAALVLGHLAWFEWAKQRSRERSRALAEEALERALRSGDDHAIGWSYSSCSLTAPDLAGVVRLVRLGATHHVRAGADQNAAHALSGVAYLAIEQGEYALADDLLREAVPLALRSGDPFTTAHTHGNAGLAALFAGRIDEAQRWFEDQLETIEHGPAWLFDLVGSEALIGLAAVAAVRGDYTTAARLAGRAHGVSGVWMTPEEVTVEARLEHEFLAPARSALGDEAWRAAFEEGRALLTPAAAGSRP